jgi:hypothetical protein
MPSIRVEFDERELRALAKVTPAIRRALKKAGMTGLRDARSEASKRIRARKRLKAAIVAKALVMDKPLGKAEEGSWALRVRGTPVPLTAYPHRQTKKGVSVEVNKGKRTLIKSAFIATMTSGHRGIFLRRGAKRLPIDERFGSRPVDALLHKGEAEAVGQRGARSMVSAFARLLEMELKGEG